jgi:hypothetical protein
MRHFLVAFASVLIIISATTTIAKAAPPHPFSLQIGRLAAV